MNEVEWQAQFVDLAHVNGWHHLHVRRSIGRGKKWVTSTNVKGWPDLLLWHVDDQRVLAVELKVAPNVLEPEQIVVLGQLRRAGVEVAVLYPDMLDTAIALLARRQPSPRAELADVLRQFVDYADDAPVELRRRAVDVLRRCAPIVDGAALGDYGADTHAPEVAT